MFRITIIICFCCLAVFTRADSPITSIAPCTAYSHVDWIHKEMTDQTHFLSESECDLLFDSSVPLDYKFAFINALGWGDSTHVQVYIKYLSAKYKTNKSVFDSLFVWRGNQPATFEPASFLQPHDYSCLAFLKVNGDYFQPLQAYYCAYKGVDLNPSSEAASYIYGLVMAQFYLNTDWCQLYTVMEAVKTFDEYSKDRLRPEAILNIFEYINSYKVACDDPSQNFPKKSIEPQTEETYEKPSVRQKLEDKSNAVDLVIIEILEPEFISDLNNYKNSHYLISFKIKNAGTISSIATNAVVRDLDLVKSEIKKRKYTKEQLKIFMEEMQLSEEKGQFKDKDQVGFNDEDWSVTIKIPILQPGEEIILKVMKKGDGIYTPNCEIEVILDADDNIEEKNERNNSGFFINWG